MRNYLYALDFSVRSLPVFRKVCESADDQGRVQLNQLPLIAGAQIMQQAAKDGKKLPGDLMVYVGYYSRKPGWWIFESCVQVDDDAFIAETAE